jgi:hypothetical protein
MKMLFKLWTKTRGHLILRQFLAAGLVVAVSAAQGQVTPTVKARIAADRKPASYVPDDDVIVKPVDNELSFYQQYVASDNSREVIQSRNQLRIWNENQQFADQYGLDSTLAGSPHFVPTPEEKFEYFKERYMRYLRQRGEQPLKDAPKNWYQNFRASNEIDTIDEMEGRFRSSNKKTTASKGLPGAFQQKEVSLWKKTRFIFQPRVDQGLVIVGIRGPIANARAWIGVNGETEVNVQKSFDGTGTRLMFNYYAHSGRYFTSVDQRLVENLYFRVTSQKNPEVKTKDDAAMLLYAKQF